MSQKLLLPPGVSTFLFFFFLWVSAFVILRGRESNISGLDGRRVETDLL